MHCMETVYGTETDGWNRHSTGDTRWM